MPSEIRHLLFTGDEVMDALRLFEEQRRGALVGPGINVSYRERGTISAEVTCSDGVTRSYDAAQLAAALIYYCNKLKIVLPRSASKSLELRGRSLVLALELGQADQVAEAVGPTAVFTDARP